MKKRKLGSAGPEVPMICLGGNVFGWTVPEAEAFRLLDQAVECRVELRRYLGCVFELAAGNKGGESESILASGLRVPASVKT